MICCVNDAVAYWTFFYTLKLSINILLPYLYCLCNCTILEIKTRQLNYWQKPVKKGRNTTSQQEKPRFFPLLLLMIPSRSISLTRDIKLIRHTLAKDYTVE